MGSVYAGEHVVTGRAVAIKHMARELAVREDARRRFVREAQAVGRLEHPNVVEVLDAGVDEADGVPYVVQSLLRGATLRAYMTRHPQPGSVVAIGLVLPILRALAAAHEAGLVHRDVKPSNVFLAQVADLGGDRVIPKLLDFGISKFTDARPEEATQLTDTGAAVGTASYMSPEQASAERDVDGRADVWAIGVMLYELLAGERPFEAASAPLILLKVISQDPARLETRAVALRTDLADIVHRALARDRDARWPNARAFHDALAEAIGATTREPWAVAPGIESVTAAVEAEVDAGIFSVAGSPSRPLASTVGERPTSRGSTGRASVVEEASRRRVRVAVAVGLIAAALGFAGTWLVARRGGEATRARYADAPSTRRNDRDRTPQRQRPPCTPTEPTRPTPRRGAVGARRRRAEQRLSSPATARGRRRPPGHLPPRSHASVQPRDDSAPRAAATPRRRATRRVSARAAHRSSAPTDRATASRLAVGARPTHGRAHGHRRRPRASPAQSAGGQTKLPPGRRPRARRSCRRRRDRRRDLVRLVERHGARRARSQPSAVTHPQRRAGVVSIARPSDSATRTAWRASRRSLSAAPGPGHHEAATPIVRNGHPIRTHPARGDERDPGSGIRDRRLTAGRRPTSTAGWARSTVAEPAGHDRIEAHEGEPHGLRRRRRSRHRVVRGCSPPSRSTPTSRMPLRSAPNAMRHVVGTTARRHGIDAKAAGRVEGLRSVALDVRGIVHDHAAVEHQLLR